MNSEYFNNNNFCSCDTKTNEFTKCFDCGGIKTCICDTDVCKSCGSIDSLCENFDNMTNDNEDNEELEELKNIVKQDLIDINAINKTAKRYKKYLDSIKVWKINDICCLYIKDAIMIFLRKIEENIYNENTAHLMRCIDIEILSMIS